MLYLPVSSLCLGALFAAGLMTPLAAQIDADVDLATVRRVLELHAPRLEEREKAWLEQLTGSRDDPSWAELFGYAPPGFALELARLHAYLFVAEGRDEDAAAAAGYLARMAAYRDAVPAELRSARVEYAAGLPSVPSFFHVADYAQAWRQVRDSRAVKSATRAVVDEALAGSADFVFVFPEWGAHNRAMLRAEGLAQAALTLPDHPDAARWRKMAEILADDSLGRWEIEDAQLYHPIWLLALLRYADATGQIDAVARSLPVRYYLRYFLELLTPRGALPEFGDGWENGGLERAYQCLEWGASALRDPELRWAAARVYASLPPFDAEQPDLLRGRLYVGLAGRVASDIEPRVPAARSGPVLEDVIGKKLVLRSGWDPGDFYLLLNYRDEGDWGSTARDYLRETLAVAEEKAHHGHSDENSVALMMDAGSVLLNDAGYRDRAPSGPFGAYRADIFHNRVVVRPKLRRAGSDLFEHLRDDGAYRPVRTELVDFVEFDDVTYSRSRVDATEQGWVWDRTLVVPSVGARRVVVVDTVRIVRAGAYTVTPLWAMQELVESGPGWVVGRNVQFGSEVLPAARDLLIVRPGANELESFALTRHRRPSTVVADVRSDTFDAGDVVRHVSVLWSIAPGADPAALAAQVSLPAALPEENAPVAVRFEAGGEVSLALVETELERGLGPEGMRPRYDPVRGSVSSEDVAADADFLWVRRDAAQVRWAATNMTQVLIDGREVFAARPFQVFQPSGRSDVVGRAKWRRWEDALPVQDTVERR